MKITFVGPFGLRAKGTMAVRALPLGKALAARGHQVELLLPPWDSPQDSGRQWQEDGVTIHNIPLPASPPGLFHAACLGRLVGRLRQTEPDIVHAFKPKAYAGLVAWAIWHGRKLGLFRDAALAMDSDDWEGVGGWNDLADYGAAQRRFFSWQEGWGIRHNDLLTVASRALETIAWSLGAPPERVFYLPNGCQANRPDPVDDDAIQMRRASLGLTGHPVILLYTRFFEFSIQRPLDVLQAVLRAAPAARLLVVGKGFYGEAEQLLRKAQGRGLSHAVCYAGWVPPAELPVYWSLADLALYPFDDTLINRAKCAVKLVDLMAAGVPVIADRVGQNEAYIQNGENGLLVPAGDVGAMSRAALALLSDPSQREALGRAAGRDMVERYGWSTLAARLEERYEALGLKALTPALSRKREREI